MGSTTTLGMTADLYTGRTLRLSSYTLQWTERKDYWASADEWKAGGRDRLKVLTLEGLHRVLVRIHGKEKFELPSLFAALATRTHSRSNVPHHCSSTSFLFLFVFFIHVWLLFSFCNAIKKVSRVYIIKVHGLTGLRESWCSWSFSCFPLKLFAQQAEEKRMKATGLNSSLSTSCLGIFYPYYRSLLSTGAVAVSQNNRAANSIFSEKRWEQSGSNVIQLYHNFDAEYLCLCMRSDTQALFTPDPGRNWNRNRGCIPMLESAEGM